MFKRGFTLPNILALILGLCAAIYFGQAEQKSAAETGETPASDQRSD